MNIMIKRIFILLLLALPVSSVYTQNTSTITEDSAVMARSALESKKAQEKMYADVKTAREEL
jgi:hypothetical protein